MTRPIKTAETYLQDIEHTGVPPCSCINLCGRWNQVINVKKKIKTSVSLDHKCVSFLSHMHAQCGNPQLIRQFSDLYIIWNMEQKYASHIWRCTCNWFIQMLIRFQDTVEQVNLCSCKLINKQAWIHKLLQGILRPKRTVVSWPFTLAVESIARPVSSDVSSKKGTCVG